MTVSTRKSIWYSHRSNDVVDRGRLKEEDQMDHSIIDDIDEFKRLFLQDKKRQTSSFVDRKEVKTIDSEGRNVRSVNNRKNQLPRILDQKRAQNIAISLRSFKGCDVHQIIQAILRLDLSQAWLTVDLIDTLQSILPSRQEVQLVHSAKDLLHPAEVFMQNLSKFFPELPIRLKIAGICLRYNEEAENLCSSIDSMHLLCDQVYKS